MTEMRYDGCCQKHIAIMPCEQCAAERQPMTPSNLDLAREVGAFNPGYETARPGELLFTPAQLDAFAERIRADALTEYAASAKAPTESPRCSEPPELNIYAVTSQAAGNVMSINYMDESGKLWRYCSKCHAHSPAEIGCAHFAAAPVAVECKQGDKHAD